MIDNSGMAGSPFETVHVVRVGAKDALRKHDLETAENLARWIARLLGARYEGVREHFAPVSASDYLVPSDTMIGSEAARLGLSSEESFFGGSTPFAYVATKAITHGLVSPQAVAPPGWRDDFASAVSNVVLPGYSAFSVSDAQEAGAILLARGPVRLKPACARGGVAQSVVASRSDLDRALASREVSVEQPLCLEQDLREVDTFSIGQVQLGASTISYVGTQVLTRNGRGEHVYGGSRLRCVRGRLSVLLQMHLPEEEGRAVAAAIAYDSAADRCFPGFLASRRNYDVAAGLTREGEAAIGVLEQSWRWGGAAGAELAALEFLERHPDVVEVTTQAIERYGDHPRPENATILFRGPASEADLLTKYVLVEPP